MTDVVALGGVMLRALRPMPSAGTQRMTGLYDPPAPSTTKTCPAGFLSANAALLELGHPPQAVCLQFG
ncbi:hypothetical protein [Streptomyces sp. DSM 15324]|uniref:hypothetical protein n=1 Tax=Streptomyces sp. DSM 15324 TaxID=1739111 RepID=UPI00074758D5|nr:hypothetical protein [Streptomyces sp. DSM 15324]KUO09274.1 hypothetical protein AQJ58_25010 [Streptomyces sp. DSM 15324]